MTDPQRKPLGTQALAEKIIWGLVPFEPVDFDWAVRSTKVILDAERVADGWQLVPNNTND